MDSWRPGFGMKPLRAASAQPPGLALGCLGACSPNSPFPPWTDPDPSVLSHVLEGHGDAVWGLAFSPTCQRLASCSADGTVRIWDPSSSPACLCTFPTASGEQGPVPHKQGTEGVGAEEAPAPGQGQAVGQPAPLCPQNTGSPLQWPSPAPSLPTLWSPSALATPSCMT